MKDNPRRLRKEAIPVGRFSSDDQEEGDSRARQERSARRVCRNEGWELSTRYAIFDSGKSAFKGKHLNPKAQFGQFLVELRAGRVKPINGVMPVLVWEMIDRFSRMGGFDAVKLADELVRKWDLALFFEDEDLLLDRTTIDDVFKDFSDGVDSARRYSRRLQKRMRNVWEAKREGGKAHTNKFGKGSNRCPSWLNPIEAVGRNCAFELNDKAPVLKKAIELALDGMGVETIRKTLGLTGKEWGGLRTIFHSPALYGIRRHCKRVLKKDERTNEEKEVRELVGEEQSLYPPVITYEEWLRLQEVMKSKYSAKKCRGRNMETCLFTGLLFYADGTPMTINRQNGANQKPVLKPKKHSQQDKSKIYRQLDNEVCESALLACLSSQIDASDLAPKKNLNEIEKRLKETEGKILAMKAKVKGWIADMLEHGKDYAELIDEFTKKIKKLEKERESVLVEISSGKGDNLGQTVDIIEGLSALSGAELIAARTMLKTTLIPQIVEKVEIEVEGSKTANYTIKLVGGKVIRGNSSSGWKKSMATVSYMETV